MALNQQQRDEKAKAKRAQLGDKELRHRVRPGSNACLERNKARAGITETSELLQIVLMNMEHLGDAAFTALTTPPRHTFEITETVARHFHNQSLRELRRDPGDENTAAIK
ncbi:hypothetical protein [Pseudomonas sp. TMP25]|uniref:hypothetical protein n=1 Tax=Pseudomonas sp. TMP25 TaxID=3136561 RepID=UPI0031014834